MRRGSPDAPRHVAVPGPDDDASTRPWTVDIGIGPAVNLESGYAPGKLGLDGRCVGDTVQHVFMDFGGQFKAVGNDRFWTLVAGLTMSF
ncbi:MAG TPA: hypothetical protein VFG69_16190 [Nannocystaceae bacterium]|nr:hypothetical protein [Nannocystaceae bacterium]